MQISTPDQPTRLASIDVYRGFVMFLMMAEVLELRQMAEAFPDSKVWQDLAYNQTHVMWRGCSLHDLIQPSFSFLVGTALPFSLANRAAREQSLARVTVHAAWRAFLLTALGVFLRSTHHHQTNFTFEDTLSQIGLGYFFLFLLAFVRPRWLWWVAVGLILVGYWLAFALYPLPGPDFDYAAAGVPGPPKFTEYLSGFAAHWNINSNAAWAFDTWFLNLFPREAPFIGNEGGYSTLSFIPTLGTMTLGMVAGDWLRVSGSVLGKLGRLIVAGAVCMGIGWTLDYFGICPNVKKIWTPAWTLFSGGWCFFLLAGFYLILDVVQFRFWAFPLKVIGMNSIVAYCQAHLINHFIEKSFKIHLGEEVFKNVAEKIGGEVYEPLVTGATLLAVQWLILFWMYRKRVFVRI
jgi:heparan-alpha-glucosaminide N-acetyltransferase